MDKNQGYEIIQAVMLENGRGFALGHHPMQIVVSNRWGIVSA